MTACGLSLLAATASAEVLMPVDTWSDSAVEACEEVPHDRRDACLREAEARERTREADGRKVERAYLRPLVEHLAASSDPRMLAIAANLWPSTNGKTIRTRLRRLREQAFERGGHDPVVAILLQAYVPTEITGRSGNPVAEPAMKRWRDSEPGNLVPAMSSGEPIETILARAETFDSFSLHQSDILFVADAAFAAYPPDNRQRLLLRKLDLDPEELSAGNALVWSVQATPSISPLINACKGEARHVTPTRNLECRQLGRVMSARSDSLIGEMFGAALLRFDDTPEVRAEGDVMRHRLRWQSGAMMEVGGWDEGGCTPAKMRATPGMGEGDAIRACLTDAGIPLEPPTDWNPDASQAGTH